MYDVTKPLRRWMNERGWTHSHMDDTVRSRIARAIGDWRNWWDWGHPVMWLVGRYDTGSAGVPRGRDLWWIPTEYVEDRLAGSLVADCEQRYGCYTTTEYEVVRSSAADVDWRIYDLQDEGRTVKVGLWPNQPEHDGRLQPLPWQELKVDLFLWWYLWQHKGKAQWFGLRRWVYYKALHAAVNRKVPFTCQQVPPPNSGGYSHWHCELRRKHGEEHRFRNYTWRNDTNVRHVPVGPSSGRVVGEEKQP
jgi:hypothetical protein